MNIADVTVMDCSSMGVHPPYLEVSAEFAKLMYIWNTMFTIYFKSKCFIAITFRNTDTDVHTTHIHNTHTQHTHRYLQTQRKIHTCFLEGLGTYHSGLANTTSGS